MYGQRLYALAILLILSIPSSILGQTDSRRADLDEAERLGLAAQKIEHEAIQTFQETRDRTVVTEAHRKAVESMSKAVDIWLRLDESELIDRGMEELARLCLVAGDVDGAVATTRRQAEYWHARGDAGREGDALQSMSVRLSQGRRYEEALRQVEKVLAFAKEHDLPWLYSRCLNHKALVLHGLGRPAEAENASQEAHKAYEAIRQERDPADDREPPARIPAGWLDIPESPMVAEIRTVDGRELAVLTNRGTRPIVSVTVGCVVKHGDAWQTVSGIFGMSRSHGGIGPGHYFDVNRSFAGPRNRWTDRPMGCDNARIAVTGVTFEDGSEWKLPLGTGAHAPERPRARASSRSASSVRPASRSIIA